MSLSLQENLCGRNQSIPYNVYQVKHKLIAYYSLDLFWVSSQTISGGREHGSSGEQCGLLGPHSLPLCLPCHHLVPGALWAKVPFYHLVWRWGALDPFSNKHIEMQISYGLGYCPQTLFCLEHSGHKPSSRFSWLGQYFRETLWHNKKTSNLKFAKLYKVKSST